MINRSVKTEVLSPHVTLTAGLGESDAKSQAGVGEGGGVCQYSGVYSGTSPVNTKHFYNIYTMLDQRQSQTLG